jgi:ubiquitin-activating enzyme E1
VNLALPFVALSEPVGAPRVAMNRGRTFTLWDRFDVDGSGRDMTLAEFLAHMEKNEGVRVTMLSCANAILYSFYLPKKDRMAMGLAQIVALVTKKPVEASMLQFEVCCVDPEDDDVDVEAPPVRYTGFK